MLQADQDVPLVLTKPRTEILALRARLILEEAFETVAGLGFNVYLRHVEHPVTFDQLEIMGHFPGFSFLETVDGCCDLRVVTTGTLSAIGVHDEDVQEIVDAANLRKFGPGSYKDKNGKWIKPPDFVGPEPELRKLLGL